MRAKFGSSYDKHFSQVYPSWINIDIIREFHRLGSLRMASTLKTKLLRRPKAIVAPKEYDGPVIPIRELPYELQLMISRECVLSSVPILVGQTISRWHLDPKEEIEVRSCGSMLRVSKDFRKELYHCYYEENTFELGYYYDRSNFFHHPGKDLVQHVLVDELRVLIQPRGVPSTVLDRLKLLPNLKQVSIRVRGTLQQNEMQYRSGLQKFLNKMIQAISLEVVELLVQPTLNPEGEDDQQLKDYQDFLEGILRSKAFWPTEKTANGKMIRCNVS